ncbi:unnamed protein product [Chironomus riparius]|uniref:Uncharacterized protein n=1 Tax=Chironomus riparius TaxID=315576 RepID=A0A9N9WTJ1_9DIPT|nr:unnamed protein product [Chironomus riparius]
MRLSFSQQISIGHWFKSGCASKIGDGGTMQQSILRVDCYSLLMAISSTFFYGVEYIF